MRLILTLSLFLSLQLVFAQKGALDSTFNNGVFIYHPTPDNERTGKNQVLSDGKTLIAMGILEYSPRNSDLGLLRLLPNGSPDPAFGNGNGVARISLTEFEALFDVIFHESENKIYCSGTILDSAQTGSDGLIARFDTAGNLDMGFGINGILSLDFGNDDEFILDLETQQDGKIIFSVDQFDFPDNTGLVGRLFPDGTLDTSFAQQGLQEVFPQKTNFIRDLKISWEGDILVLGNIMDSFGIEQIFLAKLDSSGNYDNTFGQNGILEIRRNGDQTNFSGELSIRNNICYLNGSSAIDPFSGLRPFVLAIDINTGFPDSSFGTNGYANLGPLDSRIGEFQLLEIDSSGNLYSAGRVFHRSDSIETLVAKVLPSGQIDLQGFGTNGYSKFLLDSNIIDIMGLGLSPIGDLIISGGNESGFPPQYDLKLVSIKVINSNRTSLSEFADHEAQLSIFPNPSSGILFLDAPELTEGGFVSILDLSGRIIDSQIIEQNQSFIDLSDLPKGIYFLRFEVKGAIFQEKVIKD